MFRARIIPRQRYYRYWWLYTPPACWELFSCFYA